MLGHYLFVALLNHRRRPVIALLNVLTLALGLAGFITAHAIVGFWDRAEQHFANADRTVVCASPTTISTTRT